MVARKDSVPWVCILRSTGGRCTTEGRQARHCKLMGDGWRVGPSCDCDKCGLTTLTAAGVCTRRGVLPAVVALKEGFCQLLPAAS